MLTNFRKICFLCLLASLIILIVASTVNAHQTFLGPSPYLSFSNSPFLGLPFDYFHLEDFEDLALNTPGVNKSTGNIAGPGIWTDSVDVDDGVIDGSGLGGASLYSDTDSGVTFTFNAAALGNLPNHVGIVWTDAEFPRQTSAFLEVFGPSGASIGVFGPHNVGDSTTRGTTAEDRFFGVINSDGISAIRIFHLAEQMEIDHLQYGWLPASLAFTSVDPCRIVDTRKTLVGIIDASTQRDFRVYGSGSTISAQGGNPAGCSSPLGQPLAAHINMVAVNPTGKGNLQAFPVGAETGAGLSVNYNTIDTNLANAGSVKTVTGSGPDITVASNFSSAHTVIDVLGYYYPDEGFYYTPVDPCRIVDTRKTSAGIINANTQRDFRVSGPVSDQGGDTADCPTTLSVSPEAAHINMVAVNPTGKGNLQAFPVGAETGAGLSVNYNTIDTNLANAGSVKTVTGSGPDITVASNFSSAHTVIDVLGYYSEEEDLLYTPVNPCRIVDTRKTSAGIIDANTQRNFRVFGPVGVQGGNSSGCSAPMGEPLAAHINMIAVNPTGKGNLQAFPVGAGTGAGLSVNYNTIDTNLANAGTVKTVTGSGPDITVASNFSSAHAVIDVLGYFYKP